MRQFKSCRVLDSLLLERFKEFIYKSKQIEVYILLRRFKNKEFSQPLLVIRLNNSAQITKKKSDKIIFAREM